MSASFNLRELVESVSDGIDELRGLSAMSKQLGENRDRIGRALLNGSIHEAREIVRGMCIENPAIAGVVNFLMTSDPNSAINAIGMYDVALAATIRNCQANFVELQKSWKQSQVSSLKSQGVSTASGSDRD